MKNKLLKMTLVVTGLLLITVSCVKKVEPTKDCATSNSGTPVTDNSTGNHSCQCKYSGSGTIERCPSDSNIWFINASFGVGKTSVVKQTKLLLPINLPQLYKQNFLTVKFDFNLLKDSTMLDCWFCGTPPLPYAQNIKLCNIEKDSTIFVVKKPVIYLYPEKETRVKVELNYKGRLTVTYPDYSTKLNGWEVLAQKDGSLKNLSDNTEHQYLFWEGTPAVPYNFNMQQGYCIKGSDTKQFLQNILPKLGLSSKEYNDMIVFWLPLMMNNPYNIIHFAESEYTESAPLTITPKPDNLIRVFMAYQPSNRFVKTTEPVVITPKRNGFTVVEWGGTELPKLANTNEFNF